MLVFTVSGLRSYVPAMVFENIEKLQDLPMNGVEATYENISNFSYPGSRPMYIYVKKPHIGVIPGLAEYLAAWSNNWGKDGPLAKIGFVAAPDDVQAAAAKAATDGTVMTADGLK